MLTKRERAIVKIVSLILGFVFSVQIDFCFDESLVAFFVIESTAMYLNYIFHTFSELLRGE